ncbi:MAG TPA: hypothetical protein VFZ21_06545 [Gemmatimonadaceae bacterium]|nr:hypothetical protein [Gemmatimonadaceae bacterium]
MTGLPPEPPPLLVSAFLDASRAALGFLGDQRGFRTTENVEHLVDGQIVVVAADAVSGFFWAQREFATTQLAGRMTYGDRELEVNLVVGPVSVFRRVKGPYALWEWLAAFGAPPKLDDMGSWVATAARVRADVMTLGVVFQEFAPQIAAAGRGVIERIERARAERQAAWSAQHAEWEHQSAAAKAVDAFRAGDYTRVISLLEPHTARLTPAERAKLALARKRA